MSTRSKVLAVLALSFLAIAVIAGGVNMVMGLHREWDPTMIIEAVIGLVYLGAGVACLLIIRAVILNRNKSW